MSGGQPRIPAYFAVARSIDEHYLFKGQRDRPKSWREAWEHLFGIASWRPKGQRMARGLANLKRGQIAVTIRGLAAAWHWPIGNVKYFLRRLREEKMIETEVIHTKIDSKIGPRSSYRATLVTICNYDKFQNAAKSELSRFEQRLTQRLAQDLPQLPGIAPESASQPQNHFTIDSSKEETGARAHLYKPHHLATSKDRRWVWCAYGRDDWRECNVDYRSVRGADIMPENRIGGRGNWFYKIGEEFRPKQKRRRR